MPAPFAPPVVLLHGCGGSPEQAFAQTGWIAALEASSRTVIAPRLPGHGHDRPSHDPATYADLAAALLPLLPAEPVDIVGFSLGAKITLDLAVRYPERINRIVLGGLGDNAFAPETIGDAAARALEHGPDDDTPPPVHAFLATWDPALNDPLAIAAILRRPANPVLSEDDIARISAPVLLVNGADDFVASMGTKLADSLNVQQVLLPGTGHFDLTANTRFRDMALAFLETAPATDKEDDRP